MWRRLIGWAVAGELERMWKEAVLALQYCHSIYSKDRDKVIKAAVRLSGIRDEI
jgi:hypothetical protein